MFSDLFYFTIMQTLAVISPGPDFAVVCRNTLRSGRWSGIATSLGISSAVFVHVLYTALGFSKIIFVQPKLLLLIKIIGCLYLSYLGFNLILNKQMKEKYFSSKEKTKSLLKCYLDGFITNLFNPKCVLFFLSLFSVLLQPKELDRLKYFVFIIFITTFSWFSFVSFFLSQKKARNYYLKKQVIFDRVIGICLILLSFKMLHS